MKRAIEYATDTAKALVESLESNDGYATALFYKLASQLTFLDVIEGGGDGYDLDRIIEIAIDKGFDADKNTIDPDQWTRDELVAFAYASIGQFD